MPTCGRRDFARRAVELYAAQDYPTRELIVIGDELTGPMPPGVRFLPGSRNETIGAKRNRGCAEAKGEYIALWDDDDWYGRGRLSAQLAPLLNGDADMSALRTPVFFDLDAWQFWRASAQLHKRMFVEDVAAGTLVFRRTVWERLARFPNASLAEDARFLSAAVTRGSRLRRVRGDGIFMYVRHGGNSWNFQCGNDEGWATVAEPALSSADRRFYAKMRDRKHPLISCIMPTGGRRAFVGRSLACFARQDYVRRELLIVDDGESPVGDLAATDPRVRYLRLNERLPLGEKRNRACDLARGDLIAHWDDDDWYAPHRLSTQVARLKARGAEVCGPRRVLFFAPESGLAWRYVYPANAYEPWAAGSGLCYTVDAWRAHPFDAVARGEDTRFVRQQPSGTVFADDDDRLLVAILHGRNSHPKQTNSLGWQPRPLREVRTLLGEDWGVYAKPDVTNQLRVQVAPTPQRRPLPGEAMTSKISNHEPTFALPPQRGVLSPLANANTRA
jgi:glycosyltransferase involved in cell wall biosynthesis